MKSSQLALGADRLVADFMAVTPSDSVVITADARSDVAVVEAVFAAAQRIGARPVCVTIAGVPYQGTLADPYIPAALTAAVKEADVWLDLTFPYMAGSAAHQSALDRRRVRYALAGDLTSGGLNRLFGATDLDAYFALHRQLDELLIGSAGKAARVCCPYGTDVRFVLGEAPHRKPRRATAPGMYTLPGSCAVFPRMETVRGTIVLTAIFHEYYASAQPHVVVQVDDRIRAVDGPTEHRVALERALRRAGGGEFGQVIHFSCGLSPTARTRGESFIEDSRVLGSNAVGMGLPWWIPGGGENHPDGVISDQSFWIEDLQIMDRGRVVGPAPLADLAERLVPDLSGY